MDRLGRNFERERTTFVVSRGILEAGGRALSARSERERERERRREEGGEEDVEKASRWNGIQQPVRHSVLG